MRPKRHASTASAQNLAHIMQIERRALFGVTVFTVIGFIFWIAAVTTDFWFVVYSPSGVIYLNETRSYFQESNSGLWRTCRTEYRNRSKTISPSSFTVCQFHSLFPSGEEIKKSPKMIDSTILHYSRTEAAFSIISIILMLMAQGFSIYTFFEHRYMFKRLAGGVHFIAAATVLVLVEVLINSINYEASHLPLRHPKGASWSYGFSFYFGCFTFVSFIVAGATFILCSKKRKELYIEESVRRPTEI